MIVIGGGVIGLEMGSVYARLGTKVTVVEYQDKIFGSMDGEISKAMLTIFKKQGLEFSLGTKVTGGTVTGTGVTVNVESTKGDKLAPLSAEYVLVSTGRRPFTNNLGLTNVGITTDKMGRIPINDHLQTSVKNIYAIGDVIQGPMLAHKSEEEGIAAIENILGLGGHVNYDTIPGVVYTHPEVATVGKTEEELKAAGVNYRKGTFPFQANSRARANCDSEGFIKILTNKDTGRILGIHIIGAIAGEMIAEGVLGMEYGACAEDIARTCHAHPTLSEAFKEACMDAYDKPIHF
jgi:dihydrolipoamide dehydrogenase